jgi:N-methylhydantoinase A/oxoprolinase/acetone carboxylase beta subunit
MDGQQVLESIKFPTSKDISTGIIGAIRKLLKVAETSHDDIENVMIGTTQFTNAFVERKHLNEVGVLRLCLPASDSLLPMAGWPEDLVRVVGSNVYMLNGGFEFDGSEIAPLDEQQVIDVAADLKRKGIRSVAVSSVFAPINASMEQRVAEILCEHMGEIDVTISSDLGRIGLLERENAAIMNASLADLSTAVVGAFRQALEALSISAPFYISQNDGTLMSAAQVEKYPVLTFASGPTNSMRGAAFLTQLDNAIVVDIGGTTTDVGVLTNGFPRESSVPVDIGGVRTNFRMPDILAVGLGGGSIVRQQESGSVTIGPDSVAYQLREKALVFGGDTLTATDILVAAGLADVGDASLVSHLCADLVNQSLSLISHIVEEAVDRMKVSRSDVPVILVGGGSILVSGELKGVDTLLKPKRSAEANAIGAAIAQVGAEIDKIVTGQNQHDLIADITDQAKCKLLSMGGELKSCEVMEVEQIPIAYGSGRETRVRVKVVSALASA